MVSKVRKLPIQPSEYPINRLLRFAFVGIIYVFYFYFFLMIYLFLVKEPQIN